MIDEKEFHHAPLAFLHQRRVGPDTHSFGDILRAGDLGSGHPVDDRFVVRAKLWFAIRSESWKAHLNQAHSAIAGRTEFLVIAIPRYETASLFAGFDDTSAFWKLMPHAINLDVQELWRWSWIGHYLLTRV